MKIRGEKTWCPSCTAPEVRHDALIGIELFVEALPSWRVEGVATEGFGRADVLALMDLRGVPQEGRPEAWIALTWMEAEYRKIRNEKCRKQPASQSKLMPTAKPPPPRSTK